MRVVRLSKTLLPTVKPSQILPSGSTGHDLLIRGGFIRQSSSGIFLFLPFGLRVMENLESLIDDEMRRIDGQKVSLPLVLSSNAWKKTGRWTAGGEMFKLKDRKDSEFCLAPTHEEEITQLVASQVSSYRQLPLRLYQIGKKFRDELRPRSGLLRGREFVMKDLYSFDATEEEAMKTYDEMRKAYARILDRIGVPYASALADSGNIGGSKSHEYHLLSKVGEDTILKCGTCGYAANEERAQAVVPLNAKKSVVELGSLEDVLENENIGLEFGHMKTETESVQENMAIVVTMKGWKPNHIKVNQSLSRKSKGMTYKALAGLSATTFKEKLQSSSSKAVLFLDDAVSITGATSDTFDSIIQGEFRTAKEGDLCPDCHSHPTLVISPLSSHEAIEIGHTFYLGTKYSVPLDATFKDQSGKSVPIQMGCFGLGVSRMIAAIVETRNDKDGMIWPICIAPAQVCVVSGPGMDVKTVAEGLSLQISTVLGESSKAAVALDDRDHQIGFKLKDGLLVGYPYLIIVGKAYQESKQVEILQRGTGARIHVGLSEVQGFLYQLKSDKRHLDSMDTLFEFFSK